MPFTLQSFVFWSGVYNAVLALVLLFPKAYGALGLQFCTPVWAWLIAGFLAFTAAVLILASRDLRRRGTFVYWESLLRYIAAVVLVPAGLFTEIGGIASILGLGDLAIGLVYMFRLPAELGVSHRDMLLDRVD